MSDENKTAAPGEYVSLIEELKQNEFDYYGPVMVRAADALAAMQARADTAERNLGNILARIHRDGGHYQDQHGTLKACVDADLIVSGLFQRADEAEAAQARIAELERENFALAAITCDAPACDEYGNRYCEKQQALVAEAEHLAGAANEAQARIAALTEVAVNAARKCFWSEVGGGRVVSRQASPDEVEAAIRAALKGGEDV